MYFGTDVSIGRIKYKMTSISPPAVPQNLDQRRNIDNPDNFLARPDSTDINAWLPAAPPVQEEEQSDSVDEYDTTTEATTNTGMSPVLTRTVPPSGWVDSQMYPEQQYTESHPPEPSYSHSRHPPASNPPRRRKSNHGSRRNSVSSTGPDTKIPPLMRFMFPQESRQLIQARRTKSNRVDQWRMDARPPYDYQEDQSFYPQQDPNYNHYYSEDPRLHQYQDQSSHPQRRY